MKIFLAGLSQETNTFCPVPTDMDLFERGYIYEGTEIRRELCGTNNEISGFYSWLGKIPDIEIIPGIAAWAVTSGKVTDSTFEELASRLLDSLKKSPEVDGILLSLHGAMVSESIDDCEGYLLERVRSLVGDHVKIVCTLDLHACLTAKMIEMADGIIGYRTYPHTDLKIAGIKAAKCLVDLIGNKRKTKKIFRKIPMIMAVENCETGKGPIVEAFNKLSAFDDDKSVVCASIFLTQPWLDVPGMGCSVVIYINEGAEADYYEEKLLDILNYIWKTRESFHIKVPNISDFIKDIDSYEKMVCIVELGDIVSAGGIGDSTFILKALLDTDVRHRTVVTIADRNTVIKASQLGATKSGWFEVGGGKDYGYNTRVRVYAEVVNISDEPFIPKGASLTGIRLDAGRRVLLRKNNIYIIVSEYGCFNHDPELLRIVGLDPGAIDIVVQKTHQLFKSGYKEIMKSIVYIDTPGFTDRNLSNLAFKKISRPMYPLEDISEIRYIE